MDFSLHSIVVVKGGGTLTDVKTRPDIERLAIKLAELDGTSDLAWFIKQDELDPHTPRYRDTFLPYFRKADALIRAGWREVPSTEKIDAILFKWTENGDSGVRRLLAAHIWRCLQEVV